MKNFAVYGERAEYPIFRRSHQTLCHICQENLCVYGEYAERIYACKDGMYVFL